MGEGGGSASTNRVDIDEISRKKSNISDLVERRTKRGRARRRKENKTWSEDKIEEQVDEAGIEGDLHRMILFTWPGFFISIGIILSIIGITGVEGSVFSLVVAVAVLLLTLYVLAFRNFEDMHKYSTEEEE